MGLLNDLNVRHLHALSIRGQAPLTRASYELSERKLNTYLSTIEPLIT